MEPKKVLAKVLNENLKQRLDAASTSTGTFDTKEFKLLARILERVDRLDNFKAMPFKSDDAECFQNAFNVTQHGRRG